MEAYNYEEAKALLGNAPRMIALGLLKADAVLFCAFEEVYIMSNGLLKAAIEDSYDDHKARFLNAADTIDEQIKAFKDSLKLKKQ